VLPEPGRRYGVLLPVISDFSDLEQDIFKQDMKLSDTKDF